MGPSVICFYRHILLFPSQRHIVLSSSFLWPDFLKNGMAENYQIMIDLEPYIYRPHPIFMLPSREDAAVAYQT